MKQSLTMRAPERVRAAFFELFLASADSCFEDEFTLPLFVVYGWNSDLSDEEILEKLLRLNLARAKK